MKANILTLAITLTVGIILAGSLLMPVINDAATDEKYTNALSSETTYRLELVDPTTTTIEITTDSNNSLITVGGKSFPIDATHEAAILMDGAYFRFAIVSDALSTIYAKEGSTTQATTTDDATLVIDNGDAEFTAGTTTFSCTVDEFLFLPNNKGEYYLRAPTQGPQYINSIQDIYVSGITNNKMVWGKGNTLTDGTNTYKAVLTSSVTLAEGSTNVYEMPTMKDYRMMDNGTGYYPNRVVVPVNVEGTSESWLSNSTLLYAIPILIIIGLVMGAVSFISTRRD